MEGIAFFYSVSAWSTATSDKQLVYQKRHTGVIKLCLTLLPMKLNLLLMLCIGGRLGDELSLVYFHSICISWEDLCNICLEIES